MEQPNSFQFNMSMHYPLVITKETKFMTNYLTYIIPVECFINHRIPTNAIKMRDPNILHAYKNEAILTTIGSSNVT